MEIENGAAEKDDRQVRTEWEKPLVEELDINDMTLSGSGNSFDGTSYS